MINDLTNGLAGLIGEMMTAQTSEPKQTSQPKKDFQLKPGESVGFYIEDSVGTTIKNSGSVGHTYGLVNRASKDTKIDNFKAE